MEPEAVLSEVAGQVSACKLCQLSYSRKKAVPGEGPAGAEIMLVGEGPGFYENEQGRPFVGASGQFLDELLQKAGVSRKEVYITNVVKCRPPGNRDPQPEELAACGGYLERQMEAINPLVVVTLGRFSMAKFLPNARISEVHGRPLWVRGRLVVPMFHPAAALHQPSLKTSVERDFARLPEWIEQARTSGRPAPQPAAQEAAAEAAPPPPVPVQAEMLFDLNALLQPPAPPAEEAETQDEKNRPTQLSLF